MEGRRECEKDNNTYVKYFDTNRDERGMKRKKNEGDRERKRER